jgi:hypothetical protein
MNIAQIISRLKEPVNPSLISQKKVGGKIIDFISWYDYCDLLDERCGLSNWTWEIISMTVTDERLFITGKLTIHGDDRSVSQMATGTEILNCSSYGDPSSNAEAMCLRRCTAKFGLARYLWDKDNKEPYKPMRTAPIKSNPCKPMAKGEITKEQWLQLKANQ